MKRYQTLWLALAGATALGAAGCGDDSRVCGAGTTETDGVCVADNTGPAITCTGGTELNDAGTGCVPSDSVCADGTVLMGDHCAEPVPSMIDVTEGAEPNGLGVGGEVSDAGAGAIELKPIDQPLIVKGTIKPNGTDADFDTFTIHADGPTMLDISADGTNGLAAAFLVQVPLDADPADPLVGFQRYGISTATDTSKRFVYLPAGGDYVVSVADIRSMYLDGGSPPAAGAGGVAGGDNADYYLSITAKAIPAATPITLSGGTATVSGSLAPTDMPKIYTVTEGLGINNAELTIAGIQPGALTVTSSSNNVRANAVSSVDFFGDPVPAATSVLGGTTDTIVADTVWNYGPETPTYSLTVTSGTAAALSTTGTTATQPEQFPNFSVFYMDVAAADEIDAVSLHFNQPVLGALVDENFFIAANFTYVPGSGFGDGTFTDYKGLIRFRAPGRYYFLVGDDSQTGPTSVIATSTIAPVTAVTVTKGTPLVSSPVNVAAQAAAFTYAPGIDTDAWQLFNATGTGTGAIELAFHNPATAYGALSPVDLDGDTAVEDDEPRFALDFPAAGLPTGHVLQDDAALQRYLVTASTATATNTSTLSLDFKRRDYTDFGTVQNGATGTKTGETINATTSARYYLAHTNAGNTINTITVHPTTVTFNPVITTLDAYEAPVATTNNAGINADESTQILASGVGWVAFSVTSSTPLVGAANYNVSFAPAIFTPGTYAVAAGTTAFADACTGLGSSTIDPGDGDDSLTVAIAPPTGFKFFGVTAPSFVVSTNGYLAFNGDDDSHYLNADMPSAAVPNGVIAPYWDDLQGMTICVKTTGTKKIIQLVGHRYNQATAIVQTQVILDGATSTIELVYGATQSVTGDSATIGLEDQAGGTANKIGFNQTGKIAASTSKLFTPN